jgi:hypothetical protein
VLDVAPPRRRTSYLRDPEAYEEREMDAGSDGEVEEREKESGEGKEKHRRRKREREEPVREQVTHRGNAQAGREETKEKEGTVSEGNEEGPLDDSGYHHYFIVATDWNSYRHQSHVVVIKSTAPSFLSSHVNVHPSFPPMLTSFRRGDKSHLELSISGKNSRGQARAAFLLE